MHIDAIFSQLSGQSLPYSVTIDPSWSQGRTSYGGMTASLCCLAMESLIEDERQIRSFHANFIGPIDLKQPVSVSARVLRQGKSVTQLVAEVSQHGETALMVQGCYGHSRPSKLYVKYNPRHDMSLPQKAKYIPQIPKLVPKFLQHFDLSLQKGDLALAGNKEPVLHGWSRFKKAPETLSTAHLIALMDCWPPTMLQMLRLPASASTMSWDIEFIQPSYNLSGKDWLACQCTASHIIDGYGHEEAHFWDSTGNLIAIARQVVTIFA